MRHKKIQKRLVEYATDSRKKFEVLLAFIYFETALETIFFRALISQKIEKPYMQTLEKIDIL